MSLSMRLYGAVAAQLIILFAAGGMAAAQTAPTNTPATAATPDGASPPPAPSAADAAPVREPGESDTEAPIHLHMPAAPPPPQAQPVEQAHVEHAIRHKKRAAVVRAERPRHMTVARAPDAPNTPKAQAVSAAPANDVAPAGNTNAGNGMTPPDAFATAVPFSFVPNSANPPSAKLPPAKPNALPPVLAKASPPPAQSLPPDIALNPGLVRQSQILFAPSAPNPSVDALDAIRALAGPLNTALAAGASHIEIIAYGGNRGDHSSDARRLSLKRALAIRQLLIEGGVPAGRIDVRAMGGAADGAAADRVDVFTKA